MDTKNLEKELIENGYPGLFLHGSNNLVDSIWQDGKRQSQLEHLIQNPASSLHAKFLAAEVLKYFEIPFKKKQYDELAKAYVYALEHTSTERNNLIKLNGNLWGFLYELDDAGYLGQSIIDFGEVSIPFLIPLLNQKDRILYEGSKEATIGNKYDYRIKDFAAFYLSKIKNIPIKFHQDIEERDKEIKSLRKLLNID